jgi:hypothetical protein
MNFHKGLVPFSLLAFVTVVAGCTARATNDGEDHGRLGTAEAQLVSDDEAADQSDGELEAGLDEPLSGASPSDPTPPATTDELMERVRTNPGLFFQPAGCITTTIQGNVATHVFQDCTGPQGLRSFNGTVTSTYVLADGKLTITHTAQDFHINGATISGSRVIEYTRSGSLITRKRTGRWYGTTAGGLAITHEADFVATYDALTRCVTRDGSATTSIGDRTFERSIDGFRRCGIGRLGCPESGMVVLSRTRDGSTLTLSIEFLGGRDVRITRPNGDVVTRQLACRRLVRITPRRGDGRARGRRKPAASSRNSPASPEPAARSTPAMPWRGARERSRRGALRR